MLYYIVIAFANYKIPPGLMFGYERQPIGGSYCFVATVEKALMDGYYLNYFSLEDLNSYLDYRKMREYKSYLEKFSGKGKIKLLEVAE
jgi:hypothetical protein